MIARRQVGPIIVWGLVFAPLALWASGEGGLPKGQRGLSVQVEVALGQAAGLAGMATLSVSFLLAGRFQWMEDYFGGLDSMYREHHRLGLTAFVLLLIHPAALALRFVPENLGSAFSFLLPGHERWPVELGVYVFWLLVLLLALTLTSWMPYDRWKLSHKALSLVLLGGAGHMLFVEETRGLSVAVADQPGLRFYMIGLVALGLVGAAYKTIVLPLRRHPRYMVTSVKRLNDGVMEIELTPQGEHIHFEPGQFIFVTFYDERLTRESHPYTLCGPAGIPTLILTVKALGDYTGDLYEHLEEGVEATVEGPYGRFDYRNGGRSQIWIAGGVGVAPFLSWARNMIHNGDLSREVQFYYCVHSRSDAVYKDVFESISRQLPNVRVSLVCSVEEGHLQARDIKHVEDTDIFMCGPRRLTEDLYRQFRQRGVPTSRIQYEDFKFR